LQLVGSTLEEVGIKERSSYDAVLGVLERRIQASVDWSTYTRLDVLGLDEIALKKEHRDFVTIVSARLDNQRVVILGVLPDRQKDTIIASMRSIPLLLCITVHTVCCDMYEGYAEAVREELKTACIVVDRFHVTCHYHQAADKLRQPELQRLKKSLPPAEYQLLKGSMWAFRKKPDELRPEERQVLRKLFQHAPHLKQAYRLREELTAIFEKSPSMPVAERKIRAWMQQGRQSGLKCFDPFLQTLEHWWEEITNYFIDRASSGFVEGLNNKLKVLKRRWYGIYNLMHLLQRIYLDLEGFRLFAWQPTDMA
jgi:transposase